MHIKGFAVIDAKDIKIDTKYEILNRIYEYEKKMGKPPQMILCTGELRINMLNYLDIEVTQRAEYVYGLEIVTTNHFINRGDFYLF